MTARVVLASAMTEAKLQDAVLDALQKLGWRCVHFRPAETKKGWRTAVQGDGVGWPDIIALRRDRGLAIELKSPTGKLAIEQVDWLRAFKAAGFEAYEWRPEQWYDGTIEAALR
ncbi:MAG: hypothetical protein A3E01_15225 [Gammaproteobacteria bacterium RIFCSPHIGHO2_12_FULL_63_22]|nr:MAG: hypothetical protein A3E01_15225 [Gammaproteobacteria bacterium RIFCSPHIGHO2_12_FULL_63_22]